MEVLRVVESKSKNRMPGIFKAGTLAISTLLKPDQLDSKDKNLDLDYANLDKLSQPDRDRAMMEMFSQPDWNPALLKMFRDCGYKYETSVKFRDYLRSDLETNIPKLDKMISELISEHERLKDDPAYTNVEESLENLKTAVEGCVIELTSVTLKLIEKDQENGRKVFERTLEYLEEYMTDLRAGVFKTSLVDNNKIELFLKYAPKDALSAAEKFKRKIKTLEWK